MSTLIEKRIHSLFLMVIVFVQLGCMSNYKERTEEHLQRYLTAAGEPVKAFYYFSIHSWTPLGREYLAVWTRPREAWLIKVQDPCMDLEFARNIALTSSLRQVYARFDKVIAGPIPCRIEEIRKVDVSLLRELERDARNRRTDISTQDSGQAQSNLETDSNAPSP